MSRLYDTVEPSVITEEMLKSSIFEYGPKGEAGIIAKSEGLPFKKIQTLKLSFKNILEIENLIWFGNLTKLQLDNNIIENIVGISHLINLKWLDLSFNNIITMEGLESLVNLEDLTLFNNRIIKIENIDTLTKLQVLSIGNNKLCDLEDIKYLRRHKCLQALNIKGNPFCENSEFRTKVLAFLPNLVYLDYRRIKDDEKLAAYDKEQMRVDTLKATESEIEKLIEEEKIAKEKEALYELAFVDGLDKDQLFDSMFIDDIDGQRLRELSKCEELAIEFRGKFAENTYALFEYGIEEYAKREEEVKSFMACINEAKDANKAECVQLIGDLIKLKNKIFNQLSGDNDEDDKLKNQFKQEVDKLKNKLMELELQLVDQLEDTTTEFERNLNEMVDKFKENVNTYLAKCRDLDLTYQGKVAEEAANMQEKINKDSSEIVSPDLLMILADKDSMANALGASKDSHVMKIDGKADEMNKKIETWFKKLVEGFRQKEEIDRNRSRVLEIHLLIDNFLVELDNIEEQIN